jgi:hypothetical protein
MSSASLRHRAHLVCLLAITSSLISTAKAQTPTVLYTFPSGVQDWFRSFGGGSTSATFANSAGALQIIETSAAVGGTQAFSDGFNTIRDASGIFPAGSAGGLDLTGLSSLQFDLGHNGSAPVNVQFFTQATPGSNFIALGPDIAVTPGTNTYTLPLSSLTFDQQVYMRTIGINIRDHAAQGNLTWTLGEVRSAGTPLSTRVIADHDGGAADFDGVIANFDTGAISGGNGGQNNSGMTVVGGALQWTDLGGSAGAAIAYGNGSQNSGGSFNARPVDLSNYDLVTVRISATGNDPTVPVQFYMQTAGGFNFQAAPIVSLTVDGQFHDLVFSLAGINDRSFVDTNGINLASHVNDLLIRIDSVVYSQVPEPAATSVVAAALCSIVARPRRGRAYAANG